MFFSAVGEAIPYCFTPHGDDFYHSWFPVRLLLQQAFELHTFLHIAQLAWAYHDDFICHAGNLAKFLENSICKITYCKNSYFKGKNAIYFSFV